MPIHRDELNEQPAWRRNPIGMALAVGIAGALLILATCLGCGGLIALTNANAPKATPTVGQP